MNAGNNNEQNMRGIFSSFIEWLSVLILLITVIALTAFFIGLIVGGPAAAFIVLGGVSFLIVPIVCFSIFYLIYRVKLQGNPVFLSAGKTFLLLLTGALGVASIIYGVVTMLGAFTAIGSSLIAGASVSAGPLLLFSLSGQLILSAFPFLATTILGFFPVWAIILAVVLLVIIGAPLAKVAYKEIPKSYKKWKAMKAYRTAFNEIDQEKLRNEIKQKLTILIRNEINLKMEVEKKEEDDLNVENWKNKKDDLQEKYDTLCESYHYNLDDTDYSDLIKNLDMRGNFKTMPKKLNPLFSKDAILKTNQLKSELKKIKQINNDNDNDEKNSEENFNQYLGAISNCFDENDLPWVKEFVIQYLKDHRDEIINAEDAKNEISEKTKDNPSKENDPTSSKNMKLDLANKLLETFDDGKKEQNNMNTNDGTKSKNDGPN